ncbi:multicopper oxidase domain-containing protein [Bradyrhizobium genosp. P]|uniref:multicopper oxidase domain-containing protein n=1 Tax=Bradyrhizobium genosp. P TaxID=83641 RepID=UPI003CE74238
MNFNSPKASPTGWVYQVCYRPARRNSCPSGTRGLYGGFRFELQPGDLLKIRLVNELPSISSDLERKYDDPLLALNPTNIHTHGLLVDANPNSIVPPETPVYGDFIFVSVFNPKNHLKTNIEPGTYSLLHAHGDVVSTGVVDYRIQLPTNHPSGQFWIHPHLHGIALNQITAGLAGIITVGNVGVYACGESGDNKPCKSTVPAPHHLILKDMQVMKDGNPLLQEDTSFCSSNGNSFVIHEGFCRGTDFTDPSGTQHKNSGGNWYFTVNGQQFPTENFRDGNGEVWRIQNASGSATYDLQLIQYDPSKRDQKGDPAGKPTKMLMQLLAVDGINIHIPAGATADELTMVGGARFRMAPCPLNGRTPAIVLDSTPVCVTDLVMMPSSRVEVYVTWRDASGLATTAPPAMGAILRTVGCRTDDNTVQNDDVICNMGPSGDLWPAVNLAKINFSSDRNPIFNPNALELLQSGYMATISELMVAQPKSVNAGPPVRNSIGCAPLPEGQRRRLYFGNPVGFGNAKPIDPNGADNAGNDQDGNPIFGIGYEEIRKNGNDWESVEGTFINLTRFDPAQIVCVTKGVTETWEIVNLTLEMYNFHIHQGRFLVGDPDDPKMALSNVAANKSAGIVEDNVPLPFISLTPDGKYKDHPPRGNSCPIDETNLKAKNTPSCIVTPVVIQIPFDKVGEFVFHCHILEHEDGGMMHVVRVVPANSN